MKIRRFIVCCAAAAVMTCLLPAKGVFAQFLPDYSDVRLKRMPYKNSGGERGLTTFFYGRDGKLSNATWSLADKSRYSCNFFVYDSGGNKVEKYREFSDSLISTEKYEYDGAGLRISESFERSDGVAGTARFLRDGAGRLVSAECDKYKGWFTGRIDYSYDTSGWRSGAGISRDGQPIGKIVYTYDSASRLVEELWDFGGRWSQTFSYEYESRPEKTFGFSSPFVAMNTRFRIVEENYDFNQEGGGPSHYTYDDEGKLVTKVFERSDGLKTTTSYKYRGSGDLESSHREYLSGLSAEFAYEYDKRGRLTKRIFERSDGESGYEHYMYDRLGRLEKAEYNNMDFWLNGWIYFRYDGWGFLTGGRFEGRDGFDADITFETDADGNVVKMHWEFSFGKSQTYIFGYEPANR